MFISKFRIQNFLFKLKDLFYYNLQRLFRGYSNSDLWNLDYHLAELIVKRLKAFRKMNRCASPIFSKEDENLSDDELRNRGNKILDSMIFAFTYILKDYGNDCKDVWKVVEKGNDDVTMTIPCKNDPTCMTFNPDWLGKYEHNEELHNQLREKYKEGLQNFVKYHGGLWD